VAAVRVPSIGGPLLITPDGKFLFHVTGQDSRLVQIDVAAKEATINLDCGQRRRFVCRCVTR